MTSFKLACTFKLMYVLMSVYQFQEQIIIRDWSLLIPGTGAEGNIIFFSKKLITHPNFPSNFHTPSENLPKLSYPNMYKLLCVDNFYDI